MADGKRLAGWAKLFKVAFSRSDNPMLLLSRDRTVIAVNPAFSAAAGYSAAEIVGRSATAFIAHDEQSRAAEEWSNIMRTGAMAYERDWIRRDGSRLSAEIAANVVEIDGRSVVLVVVMEQSSLRASAAGENAKRRGSVTERELEVITRVAMGARLPEVAEALHISPSTARTHVRNVMHKLGAHSQAQLVAIAFCEGLLDPGLLASEPLIESK